MRRENEVRESGGSANGVTETVNSKTNTKSAKVREIDQQLVGFVAFSWSRCHNFSKLLVFGFATHGAGKATHGALLGGRSWTEMHEVGRRTGKGK